MIESTQNTGDRGVLTIQDKTDTDAKTVDLWVRSLSPVAIPNLPWTYSIDGVMKPWKSFNFKNTTLQQHLGLYFVGYANNFTLHLGDTHTSQLAGPVDFTVSLNQNGIRVVSIKVGTSYVKAVPYVNDKGIWRPAVPWVMRNGNWVQAT